MQESSKEAFCQIIAGVTGIIALLAIPFSIGFAMASGMIFGAPGSDKELASWFYFLVFFSTPIVLICTCALAVAAYRNLSLRSVQKLFEPLGVLFVAYLGIFLFAQG